MATFSTLTVNTKVELHSSSKDVLLNTDELVLSPEIDEILNHFDSHDILDTSQFNAIECINMLFPQEQSLSQVDKVLKKLERQKRILDKEIRELVKAYGDNAAANMKELENIKKNIHQLYDRIKTIKEKATHSEKVVLEITKDIKKLDIGKQNLTTSITFLKRLQMLVSAMSSLKMLAAKKQYPQLASVIEVINQLFEHFQPYKTVQEINLLFESFQVVKNELKKDVFLDFEAAFVRNSLRQALQTLIDGCKVVNVMDLDVRKQLIDWYCEHQLKDYRAVFRNGGEAPGLEDVSRRFSWLKRLIKNYDDEHSLIFPQAWNVALTLCEKFCLDTRKDFSDILMTLDSQVDVKAMVQAMQTTIEFEGKLDKRFSSDSAADSNSSIRGHFHRFISSCFDPYLDYYIKSEDTNISKMMETYSSNVVFPNNEETVLPSSTDLFYYFHQAMVYCANLSTGKPFLNLCRMFGKWLHIYADMLIAKFPKEDKKGFTDDDFKLICFIINTADYCFTTISQLEDKLIEKINDEYKSQIKISEEKETYLNVAGVGVKLLVRACEANLEIHLVTMAKMDWTVVNNVGDQSLYVTYIGTQLIQSATVIRRKLTENKYFRMVCDKFAESFLTKYHQNIFKCKGISEVGAEQMLLDTHALKGVLQKVSLIDAEPGAQPPAIYTKLLSRGIYKAEQLLKTIMTPTEPIQVFIDQFMMLYANEASAQAFQKIIELKGLSRKEQQNALDTLSKRSPAMASQVSSLETNSNSSGDLNSLFSNKMSLPSSSAMSNAFSGATSAMGQQGSKLKDIGKFVPKFSMKKN